ARAARPRLALDRDGARREALELAHAAEEQPRARDVVLALQPCRLAGLRAQQPQLEQLRAALLQRDRRPAEAAEAGVEAEDDRRHRGLRRCRAIAACRAAAAFAPGGDSVQRRAAVPVR